MGLERGLRHDLRSVTVRWDDGPGPDLSPIALPVIRELEAITFSLTVTDVVGDNGTGKSTRLEVTGETVDIDPPDQRMSEPPPPILASYGGTSLHEQSHGESFWALFTNRFKGNGLDILDEPEAALSPTRPLALLLRMHDLVRAGSQFLIATHAAMALSCPGASIDELRDGELRETALEDTETFNVARSFLGNHEAALAELLGKHEDTE